MTATTTQGITREQAKETLQKAYPNWVELGYVDYRDSLDEHQELIEAILDGDTDKLCEVYDWYNDGEYDYVNEIVDELFGELSQEELYDSWLYDSIRDWCQENNTFNPLDQLIKNTNDINVRIMMSSTYDCGMSNHLHNGEYTYEESFFGSAIDWLGLNPQEVKKNLIARWYECYWKRPTKKRKAMITVDDFLNEHTETTAWRLPSFAWRMSLLDIYENGGIEWATITVNKNSNFGLHNDRVGTCSMYDSKTIEDFDIVLNKSIWDDAIERFCKLDDSWYWVDAICDMSGQFRARGGFSIVNNK